MAILKSTTVSGSLRATDTLAAQTAQFKILNAPTTSNGTTYSPGSNGNFLKSNGTSIYWVNLAAADIPTISITDKTSGTLTVARGGTGATTAAGARTNLGLGSIAVKADADYVSSTLFKATTTTNSNLESTINTVGYVSGLARENWNYQQTDGAIYAQFYNASWKHQIFGDYRTGQLSIRGKNNGTWQNWRRVLDETNAATILGLGSAAYTDTTAYATSGHDHDSTYLKLSGGTMTAAIKRYYGSASTDPTIAITSNDKDVTALWIGHGTAAGNPASCYYKLIYKGTGSSPNNTLQLISAKNTTETTAITINEEGNVTFTNTVTGSITGNAGTATAFSANKEVKLTGDVTGSVSSTGGWSVATTIKSNVNLTGTPTLTNTPTAGDNSKKIATTEFVMNAFTANDAMLFKGVVNTDSDLPATHYQGWTYKVATAGTYANKVCEIGDMIICVTDGTAANNDHWAVIQNNVDGAVFKGANAFTDGDILLADGTNGKIKDSGIKFDGSTTTKWLTQKGTWSTPTAAQVGAASSSHTHYELTTIGDKRNENTTPNTYSNRLIFQGLKRNSEIGTPYTDTYSYIVGLRGWSDSSGGNSHELAFNTNGIYRRQGATTEWGNWFHLLDSNNYTDYTVKKDGTGASGDWGINITGTATTATNLAAKPSLATSGTTQITVTAGGKTSDAYTIPYSTDSSRLTENSSTISTDPGGLTWFNLNASQSSSVNTNDTPSTSSTWWYILRNRHTNTSNNYYTDLAIPFNANSIYYKRINNGAIVNSTNNGWVKVLDELNYTSYKATTDIYGVTKLNDGIASNSTTLAATANSALVAAKKVASSNNTSRLYLVGATSQSATGVDSYSYQYTYTDNGLLSALKLGLNLNGTEKAHLEWNNTDQSIDFIFN